MNVIDLRDKFYKRRIDIIGITDNSIYYAEENSNGESISIYKYDSYRNKEKIIAEYSQNALDFIQHYYLCGNSIIILFENSENSAWVIKINKNSGEEYFKRKIHLIGRFFECVPLTDNEFIIYTKSDDEHKDLFKQCVEITGSEIMANLYDLDSGFRYFIKDFKTARLIENGAYSFKNAKSEETLLLCDPYCGETEKEEMIRTFNERLSEIPEDIRDNIWTISKEKLIVSIKSGSDKIRMRRVAGAGVEGTVRFESINEKNIVFRAKVYRTQVEQYLEMSVLNGRVKPVCRLARSGKVRYYTDKVSGKIYMMKNLGDRICVEGAVGSEAKMIMPENMGEILACIDDRYIIASRISDVERTAIYDSRLKITDTFQAKSKIYKDIVVLY